MANRSPTPLSRQSAKLGADRGRQSRIARGDAWLNAIQFGLRRIARAEGLGDTNDQIAGQLTRIGLKAPRGGPLTGKRVHDALQRLGVDRPMIKRLRNRAIEFADRHGVEHKLMIFQLWHEWQRHEARRAFVDRSLEAFTFKPVHPDAWVPPWVRDPDIGLSMLGPPPGAHIVQALIGMLDIDGADALEHDERAKGEAERRDEAGEDYVGHFDDPVNLRAYLEAL